jgi:carboxylesterase type B
MIDYWSAFCRTGNPNLTRVKQRDWPAFDRDFTRLVLDHDIEVRTS